MLCFGSTAAKGDDLALRLAAEIKMAGTKLIAVNSADGLIEHLGSDFVILDVAKGIRKPKILAGTGALETGRLVSLHDFDIAFFLKLAQKSGLQQNVTVIALPMETTMDEAKKVLPKFK